jgi:hypothetical protein
MDQGEAGPVDLKDRSGCLGHPEQPSQQVISFGQGHPELLDGPGDHLMVYSHSLTLVVPAMTMECFHRRAGWATSSDGDRITRSRRTPGRPVPAKTRWLSRLLGGYPGAGRVWPDCLSGAADPA